MLKKLLLLSVILASSSGELIAQRSKLYAGAPNNFHINLGGGASLFNYHNNQNYNDGLIMASEINLNASYTFHKKSAVGIDFGIHSFLIDENTVRERSLGAGYLGLLVNYHLLDLPKSSLTLNGVFGVAGMRGELSDSLTNTAELRFRGLYNKLNLQYTYYLNSKKSFGLFLKAGWINHPFALTDLEINGEDRAFVDNIRVNNYLLSLNGVNVNLGFAIRFKNH